MSTKLRKVTVNLPAELLDEALSVTGKGITLTLIEGLNELQRRHRRNALRKLRGKIRLDLDLDRTRR
jgi:hypothetical protein